MQGRFDEALKVANEILESVSRHAKALDLIKRVTVLKAREEKKKFAKKAKRTPKDSKRREDK